MADHPAHLRTSVSTGKLLVDKSNKISVVVSNEPVNPKKRDLTKRKSWGEAGQEESTAVAAVASNSPPEADKAKDKDKTSKDKTADAEAGKDEDWVSNIKRRFPATSKKQISGSALHGSLNMKSQQSVLHTLSRSEESPRTGDDVSVLSRASTGSVDSVLKTPSHPEPPTLLSPTPVAYASSGNTSNTPPPPMSPTHKTTNTLKGNSRMSLGQRLSLTFKRNILTETHKTALSKADQQALEIKYAYAKDSSFFSSRSEEEEELKLAIATDVQTEKWMEEKPSGFCMLRLAGENAPAGQAPVLVSYKLQKKVCHLQLLIPPVKVKLEKKGWICSVNSKTIKFLRDLEHNFFPKVRRDINDLVRNIHYDEHLSLKESENFDFESSNAQFVMLLSREHKNRFLIMKKGDKRKTSTVEFVIDFDAATMCTSDGGRIRPLTSTFNYFLLDWLEVETTNQFAVMAALGYFYSMNEMDHKPVPVSSESSLDSDKTNSGSGVKLSSNSDPNIARPRAMILSAKEKTQLIGSLRTAVLQQQSGNYPSGWISGSPEIQTLLEIMKQTTPEDKLDWVNRGLIVPLVTVVCQNSHNTNTNRDIILIMKYAIHGNADIAQVFCRAMFHHVENVFVHGSHGKQWVQCGGVSYAFTELIMLDTFRQTFVRMSGIQRLIDTYIKASKVIYGNENVSALGDVFLTRTDKNSPLLSSATSPESSAALSTTIATDRSSSAEPSSSELLDGAESYRGSSISTSSSLSSAAGPLRRSRGRSDAEEQQNSFTQPLSSRESDREKNALSDLTSNRAASTDSVMRMRASSAGASRLALPKLSLPKLAVQQKASRVSRGHTRSNSSSDVAGSVIHHHPAVTSLALGSSLGGVGSSASADDLAAVASSSSVGATESAIDEMSSLARGLGETYMATDLTGLLALKKLVNEKSGPVSHIKRPQLEKVDSGLLDDAGARTKLVSTDSKYNYYMIKNYVLQTLATVAGYPELLSHMRSPVNLLLSELLMRGFQTDQNFRKLVYNVLVHWADHAEMVHRRSWAEATASMNLRRQLNFRRKLDKFVWRLHQRMLPALESSPPSLDKLEHQLGVLADYMRECRTSVMASTVVDVCFDSLLRIKHIVLQAFADFNPTGPKQLPRISSMHQVLCVFDELLAQCQQPALTEMLLQVLHDQEITYTTLKAYTALLFSSNLPLDTLSNDAPSKIGAVSSSSSVSSMSISNVAQQTSSTDSTSLAYAHLKRYRLRAVRHWRVLLEAMQRLARATPSESREQREARKARLQKMFFMVMPNCIVAQFMQQNATSQRGTAIKREMLELMCAFFQTPHAVTLTERKDLENIISSHYLSFLKMYNSDLEGEGLIDVCRLNLQVLLGLAEAQDPRDPDNPERFAKTKKKIRKKFWQLRTLNFLVKEISLEYEIEHQVKKQETTHNNSGSSNSLPHSNGSTAGSTGSSLSASALNSSGGGSSASTGGTEKRGDVPAGFLMKMPPLAKQLSRPTSKLRSPLALSSSAPEPSASGSSAPPAEDDTSSSSSSSSSGSSSEKERAPAKPKLALPSHLRISPRPASTSSSGGTESPSPAPAPVPAPVPAPAPEPSPKSKPLSLGLSLAGKLPPKGQPSPKSAEKKPKEDDDSSSGSSGSSSSGSSSSDSSAAPPKKAAPKLGLGLLPKLAITDKAEAAASKQLQSTAENEHKSQLSAQQAPAGALAAIEKHATEEGGKMQVTLDASQAAQNAAQPATPKDVSAIQKAYLQARKLRKVYADAELHVTALQLIFSLMLQPNGTLDPSYSDQFPLNNKKLNTPFYLYMHLNHTSNCDIIPLLAERTRAMGDAAFRLLKLHCTRLFRPSLYKDLVKIATGAYGSVYKGRMEGEDSDVAVKLMTLPKGIHDRCVLHDIFTEITILDQHKNDQRVSHLYDYGVDDTYFWITMKFYKCSLRAWRLKQTKSLDENMALYLGLYAKVLETIKFLKDKQINHYDIKCDNFLLEPSRPDVSDDEFLHTASAAALRVCLADFGEAKIWNTEEESYTFRNRGTEFMKSPEMLTVAYASKKNRDTYDRRKKNGASGATDVWALGCLFYELLTGEFLFYDEDWVRFYLRVTAPGQVLIPPEKRAKLLHPQLAEFLEFVCNRDPLRRPLLQDIIYKFENIRQNVLREKKPGGALPRIASMSGDKIPVMAKPAAAPVPFEKKPLIPELSDPNLKAKSSVTNYLLDARYFNEHPSQITPNVYLGSYAAALNKELLHRKLDITHVINCTHAPDPYPQYFTYLHLPMDDKYSQDLLFDINRVVDFMQDVQRSQGRVFVFSDRGHSRSAALVIAWIMYSRHLNLHEAFVYVKDRRYVIEPNRSFLRQLGEWASTGLQERLLYDDLERQHQQKQTEDDDLRRRQGVPVPAATVTSPAGATVPASALSDSRAKLLMQMSSTSAPLISLHHAQTAAMELTPPVRASTSTNLPSASSLAHAHSSASASNSK